MVWFLWQQPASPSARVCAGLDRLHLALLCLLRGEHHRACKGRQGCRESRLKERGEEHRSVGNQAAVVLLLTERFAYLKNKLF